MEIYFYQAECGEACRIRFKGIDGKVYNIFLDSGYERTFRHILNDQIKEIISVNEIINLWVISHIHDDHIGGITKYIKTITDGEYNDIINDWFYNSPIIRTDNAAFIQQNVSTARSIDQGDKLLKYLELINKIPKSDLTNKSPITKVSNLTIHILSPDENKLQKLREKYKKTTQLERNESDNISEAKSAKNDDYNILLEDFNLDEYNEDDSIENGSSISLLIEYNHKKILWLSDSHPSVILHSLNKLGYNTNNKINCEWVMVSHHGSKSNINSQLYDILNCSNYLISSNGENKHFLPHKVALAQIIRNKNRDIKDHYNLYFTYDNPTLRKIFEKEADDIFSKWNFTLNYLSSKKYWKFEL